MASWNSLVSDINNALSKMAEAASNANAAAAAAQEQADAAQNLATEAQAAAEEARTIAAEASEIAEKWQNATVEARTLEHGEEPKFVVEDKNGVKRIIISIPEGAKGDKGADGAKGESGVDFILENGTTLLIRTKA